MRLIYQYGASLYIPMFINALVDYVTQSINPPIFYLIFMTTNDINTATRSLTRSI
ncbi:hypothetical protein chmu029 [Choristoneura murinana nucleopolyhedrovirus]|uniref:Uncharacterized protein n=1 Tax=Choristoneura murinana nucleopolyhedrovirus TaxID=1987479 RepID=V9XTP3_9ABAC|nr:hypothetical protein chmu029 [Choristoneura murinana nucleopolyhedrovirus]AHD25516.1 hypothetical protein chmu029 [Choristoneura murinana nucleopolyhedrovirus]